METTIIIDYWLDEKFQLMIQISLAWYNHLILFSFYGIIKSNVK